MAYDEGLAERLAGIIDDKFDTMVNLEAKKMFGGCGYMLDGNMCFGILKDNLIVRVGVETAERIIQEPHVRVMDFTGKVMKGWAMVEPEAMTEDEDLQRFCSYAIDFVKTLPEKPF